MEKAIPRFISWKFAGWFAAGVMAILVLIQAREIRALQKQQQETAGGTAGSVMEDIHGSASGLKVVRRPKDQTPSAQRPETDSGAQNLPTAGETNADAPSAFSSRQRQREENPGSAVAPPAPVLPNRIDAFRAVAKNSDSERRLSPAQVAAIEEVLGPVEIHHEEHFTDDGRNLIELAGTLADGQEFHLAMDENGRILESEVQIDPSEMGDWLDPYLQVALDGMPLEGIEVVERQDRDRRFFHVEGEMSNGRNFNLNLSSTGELLEMGRELQPGSTPAFLFDTVQQQTTGSGDMRIWEHFEDDRLRFRVEGEDPATGHFEMVFSDDGTLLHQRRQMEPQALPQQVRNQADLALGQLPVREVFGIIEEDGRKWYHIEAGNDLERMELRMDESGREFHIESVLQDAAD